MKNINLKLLFVFLIVNFQLFSQDLFSKIEKSLIDCGIAVYDKKIDLINEKLIIETDSITSKNYSKIFIETISDKIKTSEYQKVDLLIREKYFDKEIISYTRTTEKYGILYVYVLKNKTGNPFFDKYVLKKYNNKNILFSYISIMGNNRENFESLECTLNDLKTE